ncbi:MAG TPA: hypothetical protein VHL30_02760 [Chlamydiales bacterium]|nr:hypothetical protein [Chlamydiales bacterium]
MLHCWKCHKLISSPPLKMGFRAECPHCGIDLHTCTGCRYYVLGKPNDCSVPNTEFIRDREAMNFCEEFAPKISPDLPQPPQRTILGETPPKKDFKSLFKNDEP